MREASFWIGKTSWKVSMLAALMFCLQAARADIFVTTGGPVVISNSEYTGAPKLTMNLVSNSTTAGVAVGPDGNLYVADSTNERIVGLNPSSGLPTGVTISLPATAAPLGIAFSPAGSLFVADSSGYIRVFGPPPSFTNTGNYPCTNGVGAPCQPYDVAIGPDSNVYVSDTGSDCILQLNGTTLAFMSQFVQAISPEGDVFTPQGLHFGPNGNLYAAYFEPEFELGGIFPGVVVYEFIGPNNGSAGNPPGSRDLPFSIGFASLADFVFGLDGSLIMADAPQFDRYSPFTGSLLGQFGSITPSQYWFMAIGGPGNISLTPLQTNLPIGVNPSQVLRLTVIEGPVWVGPGVPVQVQLGFENSEGALVGPSQVVTLNPGHAVSLDVDASTLISSGRIELQPVVTAVAGAPFPAGIINSSVEVYTTTHGFGSLFYPGIAAATGIAGPPTFQPQGVGLGQSIQINAWAPPDSPCVALLSFADDNGHPIGPTQQVNLSPGQGTSLVFNPNKYTRSGRQEYVPQITPNNPAGGQGVASACLGSAEVFIQSTNSTSTFQVSSPAIGIASAAAGPQ